MITYRSNSVGLGLCLLLGVAGATPATNHAVHHNAKSAFRADFRPSPSELMASYLRADTIGRTYSQGVLMLRLEPHWIEAGKSFWYRNDLVGGGKRFLMVDSATGAKTPAFDHQRLATALSAQVGSAVSPDKLPFESFTLSPDRKSIDFSVAGKGFRCDLDTYNLTSVNLPTTRRPRPDNIGVTTDLHPPDTSIQRSPDGMSTAQIVDGKVRIVTGGSPEKVFDFGNRGSTYVNHVEWTPDSSRLVATLVNPGDRKPVYLIQSTPPDGGRARLITRPYELPGDKVDTYDFNLLDVSTTAIKSVQGETIDYGDLPDIRWCRDHTHFTYERIDRGYGRWRIFQVDSVTGATETLVDDHPATFFDSTSKYSHYCDSGDIIWRSERDGWGHLYLSDATGRLENQITKGDWVVRGVEKVDEAKRQIVFEASGMNAGEDPYFIHYYRINFDGSNLTPLTPAPGDHQAQFSPDGQSLVDTYSTVTQPQVHELRRATDGTLIATLEKADISSLNKTTWKPPQVFVAKGRDGKTDIWGIVYRPSKFDPHKKYPIVENIYAGPHDSFVPKSFATYRGMQSMAELGFIVVQIDGMGTRNRSKAFQDVCYKNIADAGLPDRILWMKALAAKDPSVDIDRVGVYGTSAGGQNSTGAVLFHPEFYKVAVSSCGCQDNRMDKIWWNEQWMGLMGPHYAEQSNITNAYRLRGKLLLMVGELDHNVPPETTYRLVDALIKSNKEFEFLALPGFNHTSGGPYGERKRRDFFVKNLLGVEPPNWNEATPEGQTR